MPCQAHGAYQIATIAVQPVATCRQSPYPHKPAIVIVTSIASELSTPTVIDVHTDTLPHLIYKDYYTEERV